MRLKCDMIWERRIMLIKCPICGKTRKIKFCSLSNLCYSSGIARCRSCATKISKDGGHQNGLKKCTICKKWKPLDYFQNSSTPWDRLVAFCRECNTVRLRDYRLRNRDKINAIGRKSYRKHQDRARSRSLTNDHFPKAQICSIIGCTNWGHRHHLDYSQPDKIMWLCRQHHAELHRNEK